VYVVGCLDPPVANLIMADNITPIDLGLKDDLKGALESLKRDLDTFTEYSAMVAKIRRASYNAHIKEGFTEEQALVLCRSLEI